MQTKTEIINQIAAKKQPDYDAFWRIFIHCVQSYMYMNTLRQSKMARI